MSPVNGETETDDRESREDPNEYGEDEEKYVLVKDAFQRGEKAAGNRARLPPGEAGAEELGNWIRSLIAGGLAFLGDEEQGEIETLGRATLAGGLLLNAEDEVHDGIRKVGFRRRVAGTRAWVSWRTNWTGGTAAEILPAGPCCCLAAGADAEASRLIALLPGAFR